jgi:hypothetical protein
MLSNEDYYQEYVKIELGHWCGLDLRQLAEVSKTKEDYGGIYGWASAFAHAHWPALRNSCMTTCLNPLHRMHRVPLLGHRILEDTILDGMNLVNLILNDVAMLYSEFPIRLQLSP